MMIFKNICKSVRSFFSRVASSENGIIKRKDNKCMVVREQVQCTSVEASPSSANGNNVKCIDALTTADNECERINVRRRWYFRRRSVDSVSTHNSTETPFPRTPVSSVCEEDDDDAQHKQFPFTIGKATIGQAIAARFRRKKVDTNARLDEMNGFGDVANRRNRLPLWVTARCCGCYSDNVSC